MNIVILKQIAKDLVAQRKGILAADESTKSIQKKLAKIGIQSTPETNLAYRRMLFTTPGIEQFLSGIILYDETIRQEINGVPVPVYLESRGILPGIKVDKGADKIAEGLDGLQSRLTEYKNMGAKFAKWRAVIIIGEKESAIEENAKALAQYAKLCQEQDIVPIIEPEVLMDGSHTLEKCQEVTVKVLKTVFAKLKAHGVFLEGIILKPNMVISGKDSPVKATAEEIAKATIETFLQVVPKEVPGIVFLSGGQTPDQATENLAAINKIGGPWQLSFSYGRALQEEALAVWASRDENIESAQKVFLVRLRKVSEARSAKRKDS